MNKKVLRFAVLLGSALVLATAAWQGAVGRLLGVSRPLASATAVVWAHPGLPGGMGAVLLQSLFVLEQSDAHLGRGFALSPDGKMLAYVGEDNGLYLRNLESGATRLLLREVGPGLDVFYDPSFSPDSSRLLLSASGGTRYYPANLYSIRTDGDGLERLTNAREAQARGESGAETSSFLEYFYSGQFSPDGAKILVAAYDAVAGADRVALMNPDGSHMEFVAQGKPRSWSSDGAAFYYAQQDTLNKFDLRTAESEKTTVASSKVLGKLADRDVFLINQDGLVALTNFQSEPAAVAGATKLSVPSAKVVARDTTGSGPRRALQLSLTSIQSSKAGRLLLVYEGEGIERIEVVEPAGS